MKRAVTLVLISGLLLGSVATAEAKKKKKKSKKPVTETLYLHGAETVGEIDLINNFGASYNKMTTTEPSETAPRSLQFTTWDGTPWNDCAGSYLLPVWTGNVSGKIVGDIKVTLHTVSGPKAVTVQVWPDLMTQTCASNDVSEGQYPEPAAEMTGNLALGTGVTEFVLEDVNFKAEAFLTMMILPQGPAPGRVMYDATDFASSVEFSCISKSGKPCTES